MGTDRAGTNAGGPTLAVNVLIVSAQFPYPPRSGFATRVYQLTRELQRRHKVTLLSYASPADRDGVAVLGNELPVRVVEREEMSVRAKRIAQAVSIASSRPFWCRSVYSRVMQSAINDACAGEAFDVVQLEGSLLCTFAFPPASRLILDEHNIEYELFERMRAGERSLVRRKFNQLEQARFRRFEQRWWREVDGCMVTSDRELPIVRAHAPETPVEVVPNGVDLDYFHPTRDEVQRDTVVFNGVLNYRPNLDAAFHLVEEIWPLVLKRRPSARLTIVGRAYASDVRRLSRPGVVLTGDVPDIRPYLGRAAVVVVPVRIGGGTRLKVLEALAMAKPVVSTSLGCEGVGVRDGEHLLVADGADAFAASILELFDGPPLGAALGSAGRGLVASRYAWSLVGERLENLYARAAEGPAATKAALPAAVIGSAP